MSQAEAELESFRREWREEISAKAKANKKYLIKATLAAAYKKLQTAPVNSFADALNVGNPLLCLPRELRDKIYEEVITDEKPPRNLCACHRFIYATDVRMPSNKWLPPVCQVNDQFFIETLPVFLHCTSIKIGPVHTAWSLRNFLEATKGFESVRSLHFTDPEALETGFDPAQLIEKCINVREIIFDLSDIHMLQGSTPVNPLVATDMFAVQVMADQIFQLQNLDKIAFPQLIKMHGLDNWLKKEFKKRGIDAEIVYGNNDEMCMGDDPNCTRFADEIQLLEIMTGRVHTQALLLPAF